MTLTDKQRARLVSDLQAARAVADSFAATTDDARDKLAAEIMRARAAGFTVPECAAALSYSLANVFRISALAKKSANSK